MPFIFRLRLAFTVVLYIAPSFVLADAFDPLPTYNQSPFAQLYGLPAPDSAHLLARDTSQTRLTFETANYFYSQQTATETLTLDGETHRTAFTFKYGTARAEWGVEIPYLSHSGGFLDRFIDRWHSLFDLPDGGRPGVARNRLQYLYRRNGATQIDITQSNSGIGDIRLLGGWALLHDASIISALRISLKLPTGDAQQLHGSGAPDLAVWTTAACTPARCGETWRWNTGAGVLVLGQGNVLPSQQRHLVGFGNLGIGWRLWNPIVLKAELRGHTPFYDRTELRPLEDRTVQLVLGGTWTLSHETALDVAVSEDLRVNTAPDVSILISLHADF